MHLLKLVSFDLLTLDLCLHSIIVAVYAVDEAGYKSAF